MFCFAIEKPSVAIDFQRATGYVRIPTTPIVGVEVAVNGHLTLPYEVGGFPWPTVEWSHDNSTLDDSKYNASHFTLHNVELSDGGVYDVVAQSHLGRAQASFLLKVNRTYSTFYSNTGCRAFPIFQKNLCLID